MFGSVGFKGYTNYIGMLLVDEAHNHTVMRVFCHLLREAVDMRRGNNMDYAVHVYGNVEEPVYANVPMRKDVNGKLKNRKCPYPDLLIQCTWSILSCVLEQTSYCTHWSASMW